VSIEGLAIIAVVYFVMTLIAKARKTPGVPIETARERLADAGSNESRGEGLLATVLREVAREFGITETEGAQAEAEQARQPLPRAKPESEAQRLARVKQAFESSRQLTTPRKPTQAPLGRMARLSTEIISEGRSLEVEESIVNFDDAASTRSVRAEIDQDDQAQAVIQRRLDAAAHRTREGREASYQAQQKAAAAAVASEALSAAAASSRLRRAIVWREILGPPLALRGEWGGDS